MYRIFFDVGFLADDDDDEKKCDAARSNTCRYVGILVGYPLSTLLVILLG